ncbi:MULTISPECIES: efflux RND transporter periplasmic adaptor subunit [Thiorhodovibrio]|uniref:efflux RND transporter periplasmic adaptor subunit n=1 Tax=Thiorhodovibrio TaxID=61593 RepID=UPI001912010B|nr:MULTISPECIES: efflux RND transporter periplasmic adaptor subunit [Thiorhodovibrio]MBK5969009.1 efflux transporter periplasmic adaptor subunit [Thiorhodovibrio winogradskyi]WPL15111.1 Multidrug transporter MdtA [Thiorhodovibrio litoralis]
MRLTSASAFQSVPASGLVPALVSTCLVGLGLAGAPLVGLGQGPGAAGAVPGVIVAEVRESPLADRIEALGTLKARESVVITANVTDSISAMHFDDGDRVKAGDVLVEMMSGEEHALLEESQARVAEAERQYQRVKSLEATGSASASLLDERRRDIETARASLTATESRLADRLVKAPFDGVVGLRNISLGALVQPGDVITTLDDDARLKLDFAVPSVFLGTLAPGVEVEARTRAFPDQLFRGTISSIDSRVDPVTRSVQVRALIDNDKRLLRPGQLMTVELLRNPRQALMVPEAALLHRGEEHFVFVVNGDEAMVEKRPVEIGARRPGDAEVLSGLTAGDRVVTHGLQKVKPGAPVKIIAVDDGSRSLKEMLGSSKDKPEKNTAGGAAKP